MFCPKCGNQVGDADVFCSKCGNSLRPSAAYIPSEPAQPAGPAQVTPPPQMPYVPNYLVWSILATICCCIPPGIVAIIYSAMVNSKLAQGDLNGALVASRNAKVWCWIAFGLGLLINVLSFLFFGAAIKQIMEHNKFV